MTDVIPELAHVATPRNSTLIRDTYIGDGPDFQNATGRTCRDVALSLISALRMADCVTVKGGVVMQQISGDKRRATRDLDLDFVRYPMTDKAIQSFIHTLCPSEKPAACRLETSGAIR